MVHRPVSIAIDERRAFFRNNLWHPKPDGGPRDIKQVWFPGVHCDVGGGYPEPQSGLSKLALKWMLREATEAGLQVNPASVDLVLGNQGQGFAPPDANGMMHESLTGFWKAAEFVRKPYYDSVTGKEQRRMNLFRRRMIPQNSMVHESAFIRAGNYAPRLPPNAIRVS